MLTIHQAEQQFGVIVDEHLDRQATIPVCDGLQAQGDIIVVPAVECLEALGRAVDRIPTAGVAVVRGENGGNTHLLLAEGPAFYTPDTSGEPSALALGTLTVPDGSVAHLAHPEHGYASIAPGTYEIRRQREQADAIRLVQD